MSYHHWKPYVSVARRRAKAAALTERLRKKGRKIEPVTIEGRTIARSFWGKAWCDHMEGLSDYANRLPRGRTYARNGSVIHLGIEPGLITAMVSGSEIYDIKIAIEPLAAKTWEALKEQCAGAIGSLIELLDGKLSKNVMAEVTNPKSGLFPKTREVRLDCSCPDWAELCKHNAAVLYGVGARLDEAPELLFKLRGVDHQELIAAEIQGLSSVGAGDRPALADEAIGAIFGLDIAPDTAPIKKKPPVKKKPSAKKKPPAKKAPVKAKTGKKPRKKAAPDVLTGARVAALRKKFAMSRAEFARLLGVSANSIRNWEVKKGPLKLQRDSFVAWEAYRRLNKEDAWEQLKLA